MKTFEISYMKTKWKIEARGFNDACFRLYKLIGGKKFFIKEHLAAIAPTFKVKSGIYKIQKNIWIWADGKIV